MTDTFAAWRKPAPQPEPLAVQPQGEAHYLAFDGKDKVERLEIRPCASPFHSPQYCALADLVYDPKGTNLIMYFGFMLVLVSGRNLQPVYDALKRGMAVFIEEFDSDRWPEPKDTKAPIIKSIAVRVTLEGPPLNDVDLSFGPPPNRKLH